MSWWLNLFLWFYFLERFRLTTKLRGRYKRFSINDLPPDMYSLPIINTTHQNGHLYKGKSTLTYHNLPKFIVSIRLTIGIGDSVGLDKYLMIYIHHYSIKQSTFTLLKFSVFCLFFCLFPLLLPLIVNLIFVLSPKFCFFFQNVI